MRAPTPSALAVRPDPAPHAAPQGWRGSAALTARLSPATGRPLRPHTYAGLYGFIRSTAACASHARSYTHIRTPGCAPGAAPRPMPLRTPRGGGDPRPPGTAQRVREKAAAAGPETLLEKKEKKKKKGKTEREWKRKISLPAYEMLKRHRGALRVSRPSCKFTDEFPSSHVMKGSPLSCTVKNMSLTLYYSE